MLCIEQCIWYSITHYQYDRNIKVSKISLMQEYINGQVHTFAWVRVSTSEKEKKLRRQIPTPWPLWSHVLGGRVKGRSMIPNTRSSCVSVVAAQCPLHAWYCSETSSSQSIEIPESKNTFMARCQVDQKQIHSGHQPYSHLQLLPVCAEVQNLQGALPSGQWAVH